MKIMKLVGRVAFILFIVILFVGITTIYGCQIKNHPVKHPNIILIYMDDLGYGDISNFGAIKNKLSKF